MSVTLTSGGKVYSGKTLREAQSKRDAEKNTTPRKKISENIVTTPTGSQKIEIYSPETDQYGLTETDKNIIKNKVKSAAKQSITQINVTDGQTTQTYTGQVVGSQFLGVRGVSKEEQQSKQPQLNYYLSVGEKRVQVSKGLYDKVIADNAKAQQEQPFYTITSEGAAYTETGQTVKDAQIKADKANAFEFLAPVEKWIAKKIGNKERIYNTIVTTKQKLARESDIFGQKAEKYWNIDERGNQLGTGEFFKALPYRAKELGAEFKSGAFNMISAPVETAGLFIATKSIAGATTNAASPFASGGVGTPSMISIYGATRDQDAAKGVARTLGEASVFIGLNIASNKVTNVFKEKILRNELKVVGESGATKTYKTAAGETFSKTKSNTRIVGKKTDYSVRSELTQKTVPQGEIQNIGKTTGKINIYETKGNKFIGSANVDARSITNTQSQKSLSFIKINQNNKISSYMDYSQYKSIGNAKTSDLSILYKTNSFSVNNAYAAKPIQITKGTSQEVFSQNLYTESGSQVGTKSRSIFLKLGLKKDAGISDLFKFDINKPPKTNFIAASNNIGTQTTKTATNLVLQQSLGKEVVIKQIVAQETTKPFIYPLFPQNQKSVIKSSSVVQTTKSLVPSVTTKQKQQPTSSKTFVGSKYKTMQDIATIPNQAAKPKTRVKTFSSYKPITIIDTSIKQVQEVRQQQKPITRQIQRQQQDYTPMPSPITSITIPEGYGLTMSPIFPKAKGIDLPYKEFGNNQKTTKQIKFKSKYVPSLEAEIFNIRGKRSRFAEISGIGLRSITKTGGI